MDAQSRFGCGPCLRCIGPWVDTMLCRNITLITYKFCAGRQTNKQTSLITIPSPLVFWGRPTLVLSSSVKMYNITYGIWYCAHLQFCFKCAGTMHHGIWYVKFQCHSFAESITNTPITLLAVHPVVVRIRPNAPVLELPSDIGMQTYDTVARHPISCTFYGNFKMFKIAASDYPWISYRQHAQMNFSTP